MVKEIIISLTQSEIESVLIALKRFLPSESLAIQLKLSGTAPITLSNPEFLLTKNALEKLVKMFWDLDACQDDVYKNAELALGRFSIPEVNIATNIHIKLCEIEPLTYDEIASLLAAAIKYSAALTLNATRNSEIKPQDKLTMSQLLTDLNIAQLELTKMVHKIYDIVRTDNEEGSSAFSIKSIRALLIVTYHIIGNPGQHHITTSDDLFQLLTTSADKLKIFAGIDKIPDFSNHFSKLFTDES